MNITIKNVDTFSLFLSSLLKIVPGCKFIITPKGTKVKIRTDNKSIRGILQTDCIFSDEQMEFCFSDLSKFFKSISLIKDVENSKSVKIVYDEPFIRYKGKVTFKLKTVKEERVEKYIYENLDASKLVTQYSISTDHNRIKKILKSVNIIDDSDARVYFVKTDKCMVCEIDNKKNKLSDSVGIPLCDIDKIKGDVDNVVITSLDNFRCFGILPSENINIILTQQKILVVSASIKNNGNYIAMKLYSSILKG